MFEAAAHAFKPGAAGTPGTATPAPSATEAPAKTDEMAALRAELARLQDKVDKLG